MVGKRGKAGTDKPTDDDSNAKDDKKQKEPKDKPQEPEPPEPAPDEPKPDEPKPDDPKQDEPAVSRPRRKTDKKRADEPDDKHGKKDIPEPKEPRRNPTGGGGGSSKRERKPKQGKKKSPDAPLPAYPPTRLDKNDPMYPLSWAVWRIYKSRGYFQYRAPSGKKGGGFKVIDILKPDKDGKIQTDQNKLLELVFGPGYKPKSAEEQYNTGQAEFAEVFYEQCTEAAAEADMKRRFNRLPLTWPVSPCTPVVIVAKNSVVVRWEKCGNENCCQKTEPWGDVQKRGKRPSRPKPQKPTRPKRPL